MKRISSINIKKIKPNPYQPRNNFDDEALNQLASSISHNGLLQPVVLREDRDGYQLIAGERRLRACKLLGYDKIDAIVIDASDIQSSTLALMENLQREDLNPIEEANGYLQLLRTFGITQNQLAEKLGKKQATVSNKLRLLNLSDEVQQAVSSQTVTERHGRALLGLNEEDQKKALKIIVEKGLNVAQSEEYVLTHFQTKKKKITRKCYGVALEFCTNTLKQAVNQLKQANVDISYDEQETDQQYTMTITIKK